MLFSGVKVGQNDLDCMFGADICTLRLCYFCILHSFSASNDAAAEFPRERKGKWLLQLDETGILKLTYNVIRYWIYTWCAEVNFFNIVKLKYTNFSRFKNSKVALMGSLDYTGWFAALW